MSDPKPLWSTKQAANYYGVTDRTIRNWIDKGAFDGETGPRKGRKYTLLAPSTTSTSTTT